MSLMRRLSSIVSRVRAPVRSGAALALAAMCLALLLPAGRAEASAATFNFRGRGWGHGVGMSQWGAQGLADKNWHVDKILARFYRGTAMQTVTLPGSLRVGLLQEQSRIDFAGNGRFDVYDGTGAYRTAGNAGQSWNVQAAGSQLTVTGSNGATFMTRPPVTIRYETRNTLLRLPQTGYQYKHGRIDVDLNASTGKLRAILIIPFEQYLYGLGEMPAAWHIEALKAQAIAGRTYAYEKVLRLGQNRAVCNCGMYASTADQAYVGVSQEVSRWVQSVDATKSVVVTYQGKPIQALYSASDGGSTENNENVFGGSPLPYLRAVCDPGDYMNGANPNANWTVTMNGDQLGQRLKAGGYNIGSAKAISFPGPRGVSGRVIGVIDSTHGGVLVNGTTANARLSGNTLQALAGLPSTLILYHIAGDIRNRYDALDCAPGLPNGDEFTWTDVNGNSRGSAQNFKYGRLFRNGSTHAVFWVRSAILSRYDSLRSQRIDLGLPVSDEFAITGGRRSNFERGYITLNASNGQTAYHLN